MKLTTCGGAPRVSIETASGEKVSDILRELGARASTPRLSPYASCPVCLRVMAKTNYARVSSIMVYTCREHGAWADHAAALRLLELFVGGGEARLLEIAQLKDADDFRRRLQKLESAQRSTAIVVRQMDVRTRGHLLLDWFDFL